MKVVLDSMMWCMCPTATDSVTGSLSEHGKRGARLFVSDYILEEVGAALRDALGASARFARMARGAVLRRAKLVVLPKTVPSFVVDDPKDDAVIQTAFTAKADFLVTADKVLLALGKVRDVEIMDLQTFAERLPRPRK
jgi:predicted nucleic acid-binding protein